MDEIMHIINNRRPFKKWSERRSSAMKSNSFRKIMNLLVFLTGNDIKGFLSTLFDHKDFQEETRTKERTALELILEQLNKRIKPKKKHYFLRILKSLFSFNECKRLKFKFSKHLWRTCLDERERKPGGRPRIPEELQDNISDYLIRNSEISSSRTTTTCFGKRLSLLKENDVKKIIAGPKIENQSVNTRYLNNSKISLFQRFPFIERNFRGRFFPCRRTWYNYIAKSFKKSRRLTDLCKVIFILINLRLLCE
jgi:hypothetical protein